MAYEVDLKQYEYKGPLDLLLDLIHEAKIDIQDIFVSEITSQYLDSMKQLDTLDMDNASEFLCMAATLLEIKSRALLPKPEKPENPDKETPERALIRQLEEYRRYKELTGEMRTLETAAQEMYTKLPEEYPLPPQTIELTGLTLQGLTRAFRRVLKRLEEKAENEQFEAFSRREIRREQYTVADCMTLVQKRVKESGSVLFFTIFEEFPDKEAVISVFLAILELLKLGKISCTQEDEYADILISKKR